MDVLETLDSGAPARDEWVAVYELVAVARLIARLAVGGCAAPS